jgi:Rap1a immunity proteins
MKACVPLVLCASIWTTPSIAETKQTPSMQQRTTIGAFNKMCQERPNSSQYAVCLAYLRGLFDGMQQAKLVEKTKDTFCPPPTPDLDQLRLVIEKWVLDNPKEDRVSIGWAAPLALSRAFPCN